MTLLRAALQAVRERQDFVAFKAMIETPADLSVGFDMPANAELYVSIDEELEETTHVLDCGQREINARAATANVYHHIGWFERAVNVQKAAGAPGVVSVYVRDGIGGLFKIAEG